MIRQIIVLFSFLLGVLPMFSQHAIRFILSSIPQYHQADSNLYLAGSFNGWNAQNKNFEFNKNDNGKYILDLKLNNGSYELKITRGGWDKVECQADGANIFNRLLKIEKDTTLEINIGGWKDHFPPAVVQRKHTAGKNVHIIDTAFLIPQLNRTRRIWVYLPDGYEGTEKRFPVLYLQDGQNIFDDATSYSGEWGVDECLDTMKKKCIVVAIDNGGMKRLNEYCPYDFSLTGITAKLPSNKGEGDQYVDFLVKILKPFIDKEYRTLSDKKNTFIAGSSMGGLISMYAILKYPDVFGGAGIFSPAFSVGQKIFDDIKTKGNKVNSRIYFYAGDKESNSMIPDMIKAHDEMLKVSKAPQNIISWVKKDGMHNEASWRKQFPEFYKWIMN